jgi:hypothetical protein
MDQNTKEFIYQVWAPDGGRWSPWVKPVLFAAMDETPLSASSLTTSWDVSWAPAHDEKVALVLDLAGADGVGAGLALAERGYRPVPLYNAIPAPGFIQDPGSFMAGAAINVRPIMAALYSGTLRLQETQLPTEAPPAFLLDAKRAGIGSMPPAPGSFDNRSVSFATDFPSANFLLAHGIRRFVIAQSSGDQPQKDLAHTLRRWQDGGLRAELKRLCDPGPPVPCRIEKPLLFRWVLQRALAALGFHRGSQGGFGGEVPEPTGSGG